MDTNDLPAELLAEMQQAAVKAMTPIRDPEAMKKACERMDRMREEIKKKHGILDIGVPAIRELRDE
jgi:succinate dehydrogenase/fumarate reductase flavoprotein subunit